jgi:hypothetical protein
MELFWVAEVNRACWALGAEGLLCERQFYSCERERNTQKSSRVIGIEEKGLEDLHKYSQAGEATLVYIFRSSGTGPSAVYNLCNTPSWMRRLQGLGSTQ